MAQRALRADELLVEASLRVGFVAPDGRPRRQPAPWRAAFANFMEETLTA
jgi:acyl-CoA thioester hydrolase